MKHDAVSEVKKTEADWRAQLTPEQYAVLREGATEAPFSGKLLYNKDAGTYACAACGNPLFDADAKFDSHCGWPSFTLTTDARTVRLLDDNSFGTRRTEVRCAKCDSHLGHVFDDGPGPEGTRYCINSVSLVFQNR